MRSLFKWLHLIFFLLLFCGASGQRLVQKWQYSWGGNRQDMINDMIPISHNQYFYAGSSASEISCTKSSELYGDEDFCVFVMDDAGNKLWEKTYGGKNYDQLASAIKVSTGGYLLVGTTESASSGVKISPNYGIDDFWVVRIDDKGSLLWEKTYGGAQLELAAKVIATPEGGFMIGGMSLSSMPGYNNGISDYQVIKIDQNGNLLWSKLYGGSGSDELHDLVAGGDGNYFLCGSSNSPVSGNKTSPGLGENDIWLVKIDGSGNKLWDKSFGTSGLDNNGTLLPLIDGKLLMVESSVNTGRIRKIDLNGNQIWEQSCQGNNQDFFLKAAQHPSGDIYVCGLSKTDNFGCKTSPYNGGGWFSDIWIAVFDSKGNKIDDMDFGGNDADIPTDIDIINDEVWISGWSDSPKSGNKTTENCGQTADGWIIRLSKKFYINNATPSSVCNNSKDFKVYVSSTNDYTAGNSFILQLSDSSGSFSTPVNIGSKSSIKSDSILVTLPPSLPLGTNYKIRVIATMPSDTTMAYPLWIHGLPEVDLGKDTVICQGNSVTLDAGLQPAGSLFLWNNGTVNNQLFASVTGLYWCEAKNSCGSTRDSIIVEVKNKPTVDIGPDLSFCAGDSVFLQVGNVINDAAYIWSTGTPGTSLMIQKGATYWLTATNQCGSTRDTVIALEHQLPVVTLNKDNFLCQGTTKTLHAGTGFGTYLWNNGETTASILVNTTGTFWVKVVDNNGCTDVDTTRITRLIDPPGNFLPADTVICSYADYNVRSAQGYTKYLWNTGSNTSSVTLKQPGLYWLEVADTNGCIGRDSLQLNVEDCLTGFHMPNAFTPNNDQRNDLCRPMIIGEVLSFHFAIYDRWGQIIYETKTPAKGWDGNRKGLPSEKGVYIWTCNYQIAGKTPRYEKGTIVLIR